MSTTSAPTWVLPRATTGRIGSPARTRALFSAGLITSGLVLGGCSTDPGVTLAVEEVAPVGPVLVLGSGQVVYVFEPDQQGAVTCEGSCARNWPPVVAADEPSIVADSGVDADLIGTVRNGAGESVVTYNGWPLYTYASDDPGEATGQGTDLNGGLWWALAADGNPVGGGE